MEIVNTIYEIVGYNFIGTKKFVLKTIDKEYMQAVYMQLVECVDIEQIDIIDGTTGEILYSSK